VVKISVIMATARDDTPMLGLPDTFIFEPTLESLRNQTFDDFEFIIVDSLYRYRKGYFEDKEFDFPVKHIPVHPNHRFWLDRGMWSVCGALNSGIIAAEGELVVRIDDCCSFGPEFLEKFWTWYKRGFFAQALVIYHHGTKPLRNVEEAKKLYYKAYGWERSYDEIAKMLDSLYKPGEIIRDSRWRFFEGENVRIGDMRSWYFGYGSASLEALLEINGYDESFDSLKGLEEVDLGLRLWMADYRSLILDKSLTVIEHFHGPVSRKAVWNTPPAFKCNYGLYLRHLKLNRWRANVERLTLEDCEWIRENICSSCPNLQRCRNETLKGKFYIDNEYFRLWLQNQRTFDLREERNEL